MRLEIIEVSKNQMLKPSVKIPLLFQTVRRQLSFTSFTPVPGANNFFTNDVRRDKTEVKRRSSTCLNDRGILQRAQQILGKMIFGFTDSKKCIQKKPPQKFFKLPRRVSYFLLSLQLQSYQRFSQSNLGTI